MCSSFKKILNNYDLLQLDFKTIVRTNKHLITVETCSLMVMIIARKPFLII